MVRNPKRFLEALLLQGVKDEILDKSKLLVLSRLVGVFPVFEIRALCDDGRYSLIHRTYA